MAVISQFTTFALHSHTTTPVGNITPVARGDVLIRTDDGSIWVATTTVNTGWVEVAALGEGLITGLSTSVADYAVNTLVPTFTIATDHAGGDVNQAFTLPTRTGGWRLIDAYLRSTAGTGGNLQLKDAAAGNAMTDAIVPGNANVITRAAQIITAQQVAASASTPVWDGAAGTPATTCYSVWMGL